MNITTNTPVSVSCLFVVLSSIAVVSAAGSAIEGIVQDSREKPVANAEIRVEGKQGNRLIKTTTTDRTGHYVYSGLPTGTYRVTLIVDSKVRACISNVDMPAQGTRLNFELRRGQREKPMEPGKHYVWVPSETGTNIAGRWIETDDQNKMSLGTQERMQNAGRQVMYQIQSKVTGLNP